MSKQSKILPVSAFAFLMLIWAGSWPVSRLAVQNGQISPIDFAVLRTGLGAAALFVLLLATRRPLAPPRPGATLALGLLQTTAFNGLSCWALVAGGAGKVAVMTYTMPFFSILLSWIFLKEKVRGGQWLAIAAALAGLVLILAPWHLGGSTLSMALSVLNGLAWAASAVLAKRMQQERACDLLSLTTWQMIFGTLVLALIAWVVPSPPVRWSPYLVFATAYSALLATSLGWLIWLYLLRIYKVSAVGIGALTCPALGVVLSAASLGEIPGRTDLAGMACILAGLGLLAWQSVRSARP